MDLQVAAALPSWDVWTLDVCKETLLKAEKHHVQICCWYIKSEQREKLCLFRTSGIMGSTLCSYHLFSAWKNL